MQHRRRAHSNDRKELNENCLNAFTRTQITADTLHFYDSTEIIEITGTPRPSDKRKALATIFIGQILSVHPFAVTTRAVQEQDQLGLLCPRARNLIDLLEEGYTLKRAGASITSIIVHSTRTMMSAKDS